MQPPALPGDCDTANAFIDSNPRQSRGLNPTLTAARFN